MNNEDQDLVNQSAGFFDLFESLMPNSKSEWRIKLHNQILKRMTIVAKYNPDYSLNQLINSLPDHTIEFADKMGIGKDMLIILAKQSKIKANEENGFLKIYYYKGVNLWQKMRKKLRRKALNLVKMN